MKNFELYKDFVEYFNNNYIKTEYWDKNYVIKDGNNPLFYCTWRYIEVKKESTKWYKRLFSIKEFDSDNSVFGYELNPIIEIECLCPMLRKVDIVYRGFDGNIYSSRVNVDDIYRY